MEMFSKQFTCLMIAATFLGLVRDLCSEELKMIAENEIGFSTAERFRTFHPGRAKACASCDRKRTFTVNQGRRSQVLSENRFPDSNESQIIDLMVVYESTVKNQAGGTEKINAVIAQAVEDTNICFSNSLIPLRVRLVHAREVYYTLQSYNKDLDRLSIPNDGYMDTAYIYRDMYGADIVSMLSSIVGSTGGLGDTLRNSDMAMSADEIYKFGFNINLWSELGAPEYTLAHEIGHALGCVHNREAEVGNNDMLFPYAFGKRWFSEGQGVRTVMAYDDDYVDTYPTTVPYFSNPSVSYFSYPTGNAHSEDNAQVIRRASSFVSSLRPVKVQGIHPSQFDLVLEDGVLSKMSLKLMMNPESKREVFVSLSDSEKISLNSPPLVLFDSSNWNIYQEIELIADNVDRNHTAKLLFSASGMDSFTVPVEVLTSSRANPFGWVWMEKFPWAYSYHDKEWLYFSAGDAKWMSYDNAEKAWSNINGQSYPGGWLWFNRYPWVFSDGKKDWIYFQISGGELLYYSNREKVWREFSR